MYFYILSLWFFFGATIFAAAEIEAEGTNAWAQGFETWRRSSDDSGILGVLAKILKKPITGYHLFFFLIPPFLFHTPFVIKAEWSLNEELYILSIYFSWFILWDFLWFVLNPNFTTKKFKKEFLPWYSGTWVGRIPMDYIISVLLSLCAVTLRSILSASGKPLLEYGQIISVWIILLIVIRLLSPYYHKWYWRMREQK